MNCILISESKPHRCGYCKSENSSISDSIYVPWMEPIVYQKLIDRGWRRSGRTCYKPRMQQTCCPQYTIKCDAVNFQPSKSQKKLLKKWLAFLRDGKRTESAEPDSSNVAAERSEPVSKACKTVKKGVGPDLSKPPCRKAKLIRLERKKNKAIENKAKQPHSVQKLPHEPKTLNDFLLEIFSIESPQHKLKIEIVPGAESTTEVFELYKRYQQVVHNDETDDITEHNFISFLVSSPLKDESTSQADIRYGSFHQKYWLDDQLIACGVIDILPFCLSSVYFLYDPAFDFLSLGTFGSLVEIFHVQKWQRTLTDLKWYYMGYYIHTCTKMRYKINMKPSYLLCPETYGWIEAQHCIEKLNVARYAKLSEDDAAAESDKFERFDPSVRVTCGRRQQTLEHFLRDRPANRDIFDRFGNLLGHYCTRRLQLISIY